jgi:hypothetical protein
LLRGQKLPLMLEAKSKECFLTDESVNRFWHRVIDSAEQFPEEDFIPERRRG